MSELSDMDLLRLHGCAQSTKYGMADKGFPKTLSYLATKGLVKEKDGGYVVTEAGLLMLKLNMDRIFPSRKRSKKKFEDEE